MQTTTQNTQPATLAAWQDDCENSAINFSKSEMLAGIYAVEMVRVFTPDLTFPEYEERRVFWGDCYLADRPSISRDAVDAAFNRAIKKAFADIGGYTKPKAQGDAVRKATERSVTDTKAAEIANSGASVEELERASIAALDARQAIEKAAKTAKGEAKKDLTAKLVDARAQAKIAERAYMLRNQANANASKERRAALLETIRDFIKDAEIADLERVASECHHNEA